MLRKNWVLESDFKDETESAALMLQLKSSAWNKE